MTDRHPDRKALEQFLDGGLPEAESRILQRHLFLCPVCEDRMIALLPGSVASPHPAADEQGYRGLIHRLLNSHRPEATARRLHLMRERQAASELWRDLAPQAPDRRRALIRNDPRYRSWGLFELLVERSRQAVLDSPGEAEGLLRLALDVAEQVSPEEYGPGSTEAAKARAWTWMANAWRVHGDFRQAERAFQTAEVFLAQSWLDPLDEALLLELKAPLRRAQGKFDEALELIAEAIAIYREVNEPHLQGRALMVKGLVLRYQGNLQDAADCYRTSLFLLDDTRDPRLLVTSQYNLIGCLEAAGHGAEAAALIPEAKALIEQAGTRSDLIRLRWTEGRIARLLERFADAEAAFLEVRDSFVADERAFDAAQVSLELAALYLQQGRSEETQLLATELIPIFQSRDIYREGLAAVIAFQQAAVMDQLDAGLVQEIAAYLEQASMQEERSGLPARGRAWGFLEAVIERSLEVSRQDPRQGEERGRLALMVADSLTPARHGIERLQDLRARGLAYVGNALRIQSDLKNADQTFRRALTHLRQGTGDRLELGIFLDLLASLRRSQRRFQESFRLLRKATSIFLELGDRHRAGRTLVNLSAALIYAGRAEESVPVLHQALDLIDPKQEPRLLLGAKHNLILVLTDSGRFLEADRAYTEARPLYRLFLEPSIQNRRKWVKGKIARGLGKIGEAESLFLAARDGFMAEGIPYETALVSLDLSLLYADQGRLPELKRLAMEIIPIFASRQIHREALTALAFFQRAVEAEQAGIEVVEKVAEYLRKAQYTPDLLFEEIP